MDPHKRNISKRGYARGTLTRLDNEISQVLGATSLSVTNAVLTKYILQLEKIESNISDLNEKVQEGFNTEPELEKDLHDCELIQSKIIDLKAKCLDVQHDLQSRASSTTQIVSPNPSPLSFNSAQLATTKLPRIVIEKYYGDISKWQEFWTSFETTIHNSSLPDSGKLVYLKSYLGGTALTSVSGISMTYANAIITLQDRFGRDDLVEKAHIEKIRKLEAVRKSSDIKSLRSFFDSLYISVMGLEALNVKTKYGGILIPIITELLPEDIVLSFTQKNKRADALSIDKLIDFLKEDIESREQACNLKKSVISVERKPENAFNRSSTFNKPKIASTSSFKATVAQESPCGFCKGSHRMEDCTALTAKERKEIFKKRSLCFICAQGRHMARFCKRKREVSCKFCNRCHSHMVCEEKYPEVNQGQETNEGQGSETSSMSTITSKKDSVSPPIYLRTAWAKICHDGKEVKVRCLLDDGSHRTYVSSELCQKMNLPVVGKESLNLTVFEGKNKKIERERVQLTLGSLFDSQSLTIEAIVSPKLSGNIPGVPRKDLIKLSKEKGWNLADTPPPESLSSSEEITMLLGADYYWKVSSGKTERIGTSLMAHDTILGWTIHGRDEDSEEEKPSSSYNICVFKALVNQETSEDELISDNLKAFWKLDSLGIVDKSDEELMSEKAIKEEFDSKITYDGNRYSVCLPWKEERKPLNNNYIQAKRRFQGQLRKFRQNPELFDKYADVIETYIENGIVEKVKGEGENNKTFYLPHREVIKEERSTTKLRVVFDGSSHSPNFPSINDCLHSGPALNVDLLGLLVKFRKNKIAFTADIEKAFLQVGLSESDRDVTRFLWIKNRELNPDKLEFEVLRMTRVLFGLTSSPYLLAATIRFHIEKYKEELPEAYELLRDFLYVDDLVGGAQEEQKALDLAKEAKGILSTAAMPLRKFQSNSTWLKDQLSEEQSNQESKEITSKPESTLMKVLGISWKPEADVFCFDVSNLLTFIKDKRNTKRFILQASSRIFDPIGLISPFTVRIKCLYQELWKRGTDWDQEIDQDLTENWNKWCLELQHMSELEIPRHYGSNFGKLQLHCFTDASERAFGAVVYVRSIEENGTPKVLLVASKSRVSPLKKLTVPKLELMGAIIGSRLMKTIKSNFEKEKPSLHFWCDNQSVISWIKSNATEWKPFVENRVCEIQELTEPVQWKYVPTKQNPADFLTRGLTIDGLKANDTWWTGPEFLKKSESEWPVQPARYIKSDEAETEKRPKYRPSIVLYASEMSTKRIEPVLKLENYSRHSRVVRTTAWIRRFIFNCKNPTKKIKGELSTEEIDQSEIYWVKLAQQETYPREIKALKEKREIHQGSVLSELKPFLDQEGLCRMGGRLGFANMTFDERHPIILPTEHHYTYLLIQKQHRNVMHMSVTATLSSLRGRYWIPRGRQIVKKQLAGCVTCKRMKSRPFIRETAPLPPERVNASPAFETTGVDFAGPVYVRCYDEKEGKFIQSKTKSYIALFTCAITRAVHLELVSDLSAENFILALKRFVGRRGVCRLFLSDNSKTFKRTEKELSKLWNSVLTPETKQYFGENKIEWKFIVDYAPWWGGIWERMVRTVKDCLKKVLCTALLSYEEFETVLIEVESVVNSRPITFTASDHNEPSPLTPSHFLIGKRLDALPPRKFKLSELEHRRHDLTSRWKHRQELVNRFWVRWRKEYLLELRTAQIVKNGTKWSAQIKVDDIVLIKDDKLPRHLWKLGKVLELHLGRDGICRSVSIKKSSSIIKRPVQLLYPLEV